MLPKMVNQLSRLVSIFAMHFGVGVGMDSWMEVVVAASSMGVVDVAASVASGDGVSVDEGSIELVAAAEEDSTLDAVEELSEEIGAWR